MKLPFMQNTRQYTDMQQEFMGINKSLRADPRQWKDMTNISLREFPTFAPRRQRGYGQMLTAPGGIMARDALVWVDGDTLYINALPVTGLVLTEANREMPKKLISMGAYIIIMPDRKYVNTANLDDYGSIDSSYTYTGDVLLTPSRVDGTDIPMGALVISVTPPPAPNNGDYWIDSSGETHILRQYSAMSETWVDILSTYTRIDLPGIGDYFKQQDGVTISGLTFEGTDPELIKQIGGLNASKIIYAISAGSIVVPGLLNQAHTLTGATVTVTRRMPDMDFIIESENRLWGCKYGVVDGKTVNEIYASKQGDFKNWQSYMGISTDSYAATVGSDGKFTGAITFQGYPLFFKETCLHKIYGNMPSNYRIETSACRGVQDGSYRSLQIVNELLYYKGRTDVLVYDGSDPVGISEHLGPETYRNAVAGAYKHLYYISMQDSAGVNQLFEYDSRLRMWCRHDQTQAMGFAQVDDDLLFINTVTGDIVSLFGKAGTPEGPVAFSAQTGIIGYEYKDHKYISRINIRALIPADGSLSVHFRYDSVGEWRLGGTITGAGLVRSTMLPVIPRRCDHFEMKLTGVGDVRIFSIAKVLEIGSDGRWTST